MVFSDLRSTPGREGTRKRYNTYSPIHLLVHEYTIHPFIPILLPSQFLALKTMSWVDYDRDGHSDTSKRHIRRHPLSYSCAFKEYPREPRISFYTCSYCPSCSELWPFTNPYSSLNVGKPEVNARRLTLHDYDPLDPVLNLLHRYMCKSRVEGRGAGIGN